ncbi:MAG: hypothetical protein RLZZ502_1893 [Pseudomonadota bacterium]|jgi:maleylacetoacetate isomerase/maleylpyruvate isomerase
MHEIILYNYFRSSAAYRVRIALNLKNISYERQAVHLVKGEHKRPEYAALNPQQLVPAIKIDGHVFTQSLAIIEYLEETRPEPPLLPRDAVHRAQARALADLICMDIHPLNNVRVLKAITALGASEAQKNAWIAQWICAGFDAIEPQLGQHRFAAGHSPGLVDICLVPQVFSARRFNVDMSAYPRINEIDLACNELEAFAHAHPKAQPDYEV